MMLLSACGILLGALTARPMILPHTGVKYPWIVECDLRLLRSGIVRIQQAMPTGIVFFYPFEYMRNLWLGYGSVQFTACRLGYITLAARHSVVKFSDLKIVLWGLLSPPHLGLRRRC